MQLLLFVLQQYRKMPCSSADDGAWGESLENTSFALKTNTAGTSGSTSRLSQQQRHDWVRCLLGPQRRLAFHGNTAPATEATETSSNALSLHKVAEALRASHATAAAPVAVVSPDAGAAAGGATVSVASLLPVVPPLRPMQLEAAAAAVAARAAGQAKQGELSTSDGDGSDMEYYSPISSPLRELPAPSLPLAATTAPAAAAAVGSDSDDKEQQQRQQQQEACKAILGSTGL